MAAINFPDSPPDGATFSHTYNGLTQFWMYKSAIPGWISQGFGITQGENGTNGTNGTDGTDGATGATGVVGTIDVGSVKYSNFDILSFSVDLTGGNVPLIGATFVDEELTITHYIPNRNISFNNADQPNALSVNPTLVNFKTTGDTISISSLTSDSGITFDFSVSIPDSYNTISSVKQENTEKATKVSNLNFIGGTSDTFYDLELSVTQGAVAGLTQANIAYYLPKRVIVQINGNSGGSNNIWDYNGIETNFSKTPNTNYAYNLRNMFEAGNSADSAYGLPSDGNTFSGFTGFALKAVPNGTFVEIVAKDVNWYYFGAPNPIDGSC